MTDAEIRAVGQVAVGPAQRMVVALAAVHAAPHRQDSTNTSLIDHDQLPSPSPPVGSTT